ncbi:ribonuclease Y [Novipirellula artificiosorum]|uniref:Ribonuclease Y n=1 Tax=Novipirellula artificiosorum TaxID=2528016 RepID=A0A5C6DTM6_9BACT|nr:ribonuclease Y [Novipirellula artificiosorum]TWU40683.1 Ribonuclease Y [Novipirellula artificiosorum]
MIATTETTILYCAFSFLVGAGIVLGIAQRLQVNRRKQLQQEADRLLEAAKVQAETLRQKAIVDGKESVLAIKSEAEKEIAAERKVLLQRDGKLDRREESLSQQEEGLRKQQRGLENAQTRLDTQLRALTGQRAELEQTIKQQQVVLEKASGMTREEASEKLLSSLQQDLQQEIGSVLLKHQKHLGETVKAQGREMLLTAIQRYASAHTAESTTSTVDVPSDDMKGRIIGREGRNIRAFEKATGVDVIIDDTPGVVIVSGFDPVRREIARQSLQRLISDGRIHPSRIEEVVKEATAEMDDLILQKGREAADEVNVNGVHERVLQMLGRLHFRTSYSQNVLRHSVEVAFLSGLLAEMLGMDADLARRCGLLHDIGKAADHELEGGHPKIGADLLRRHHEGPEVVHAALGHHDEIVTEHPYTMLVATGDACSASRPGARRESLERYIKRMEELESIAERFSGVRQAYAISAGRELRVIVNSDKTTDEQAATICRNIAKAFEQELTYPGEIKVTVLRESRFIETAK